MKTLNRLYNNSCRPGNQTYKRITDKITLIDNFFENFELARDFFTHGDIWECIQYQGNSKPGYESLFPSWVGRSLMEKFVLDNKIVDHLTSYNTVCNFFHNNLINVWTISNSNHFPHHDSIENNGILQHICLINLNHIPVSTKFYTYKNQKYCNNEIEVEWYEYVDNVSNELFEYYDDKNITGEEVKMFLDKKKYPEIKIIKEVSYNSNQAILYPANLFHSANVTEEFTEDNPRVLLRINFEQICEPDQHQQLK